MTKPTTLGTGTADTIEAKFLSLEQAGLPLKLCNGKQTSLRLKQLSEEGDYPIKRTASIKYGEVNTYHIAVIEALQIEEAMEGDI